MKRPNLSAPSVAVQAVLFIGLTAFVGYFSDRPVHSALPADQSELKLVIRHSGKLMGECHQMSTADLDKLAPNMRKPMVCPREKSPLSVELSLNDSVRFSGEVQPSGIHNDGVLALYRMFPVSTGDVVVQLRIKDDIRQDDYTHTFRETMSVDPSSIVVLRFDDEGIRAEMPGSVTL